jgi:hypothetical protein
LDYGVGVRKANGEQNTGQFQISVGHTRDF